MPKPSGAKPDWEVRALEKGTDEKGLLGYGWNNPDGSINLSFNPFVVVPVGKRFAIRMFSNNRPGNPPGTAPNAQGRDLDFPPWSEDDPPKQG